MTEEGEDHDEEGEGHGDEEEEEGHGDHGHGELDPSLLAGPACAPSPRRSVSPRR